MIVHWFTTGLTYFVFFAAPCLLVAAHLFVERVSRSLGRFARGVDLLLANLRPYHDQVCIMVNMIYLYSLTVLSGPYLRPYHDQVLINPLLNA